MTENEGRSSAPAAAAPGGQGASPDPRRPVVAHLDHSTARGGAELALIRMLTASGATSAGGPDAAQDGLDLPGWTPVVVLPGPSGEGSVGPFAPCATKGLVARVGPSHRAGLGSRAGALGAAAGAVVLVRSALALRRSGAFRGADVVHANTSRAAAYGALAVRRHQRFLVHLRDFATPEALGRHGSFALRLALRRADGVVANSRATLESARPFVRPGTPTLVLQSPLGLPVHAAEPGRTGDGRPRVVGMVARIAAWKGQELLVEAFAKSYGGTATRLRLVGAPEFGDENVLARVRATAERLGVAGQLELPGNVEDVAAEIAAMDVCVQASTMPEPLGQNVLQYLALGRPTVVADQGGPTEWVRDGVNGLLFRTGAATSLADALTRLADPGLRDRLASGAVATPGIATDAEVAARLGEFIGSLVRP